MRLFSKIENSKDITDKEYVDGLVVKSINGLAGGTLTSPITLTGGDGANASKMILSTNGQITDSSTSTMLGFSSGNYIVGSANYPTTFRGKQTRPTWNGKDLALKSDVPTVPTNYVTTDTSQTITGNKTFTTTSSGGPQIGIYNGQMSVAGGTENHGNIIWNTPSDQIAANFSVNESGAHLYLGVDAAADIRLNEDAGTSGQVLTSQGAGVTPMWATPTKGTVTQVKVNGTTHNPNSAGLVDLGSVGGVTNISIQFVGDDTYTLLPASANAKYSFIGVSDGFQGRTFTMLIGGNSIQFTDIADEITLYIDAQQFSDSISNIMARYLRVKCPEENIDYTYVTSGTKSDLTLEYDLSSSFFISGQQITIGG